MSLTLTQAQTLLSGIVGKSGGTRYLGLSTTEPQPVATGNLPLTGATFTNYNITEPTIVGGVATSYARIALSATSFANDATGAYVDGVYKTTIANTKEIHFTEALQDWGYFKYFFITTVEATGNVGAPVYVGKLTYDEYVADTTYDDEQAIALGFDGTATTTLNFDARKSNLFVVEDGNYVNCSAKEFDESASYFVAGRGIHIEENTVPLVRANLLKISVQ